jgi:hypothetical protein
MPFGFVFIQLSAHRKASIGSARRDQLHDRAIGAQRLTTPIDTDKREKAMLDLVPVGGIWQTVIGSLSSSASF